MKTFREKMSITKLVFLILTLVLALSVSILGKKSEKVRKIL